MTAVVLVLFSGCGPSSALDQSGPGKPASYQPGTPGFDMEAIQAQEDSVSSLDLFLSIPYPSLIFEAYGGGFRARYEVTLRLSDRTVGELATEVSWPETTFVWTYEKTQSFEPITFRKHVLAPAGTYRALVTLEDMVDTRKAVRGQALTIVDPGDPGPSLGRISLITGLSSGRAVLQISYYISLPPDSLDCVIGVRNLPRSTDSRLEIRVIRFAVDTLIAIPPYYYNVLQFPSGRRLVNFENPDTVFSDSRTGRTLRKTEMLDFRIPPLPRGLCRIEISAATLTSDGRDTTLSAARYYSVQGPGFPRPATYRELLDAATYIAKRSEIDPHRLPGTAEEKRKTFEQFWLSLAGDPARAAALIKRYYARVEQANRLYTVTRDGWRSDRGMLYCILGPPAEITNQLDKQTWYYDLSGNPAENTYVFQRVFGYGGGMSVEDYILYRQASYESMWERMVNKWRTGETW